MFFAHFLSVALIGLLPVMLLALIVPYRHVIVPLAWAIGVVLTCLLLVDTLVFQQYRFLRPQTLQLSLAIALSNQPGLNLRLGRSNQGHLNRPLPTGQYIP